MLFDSHAHLDDKRFDEDRQTLIDGLPSKGVSYVLNAGSDLVSSQRSINLAEDYSFIYAAVGVHPHDAQNVEVDYLQKLEKMVKHSKVVAIGEIGLDYHYDFSPRDIQIKRLIEQIELAERVRLPIVIHDREAHEDILKILKEHRHRITGARGVLHCYSGSWEMAKVLIDLGFLISIGGAVTFKNAVKTVDVVKNIDLNYLLIETDSPYLAPDPLRGKRNDPSLVQYIARRISEIRGEDIDIVAAATLRNAMELFTIERTIRG